LRRGELAAVGARRGKTLEERIMRDRLPAYGLAAVLVAAPGARSLAQEPASSYPPPQAGQTEPRLVSPDKAGSANVMNAAAAPVHDLNLVRQKIPVVLLQALADPYAAPTPANCETIVADVQALKDALGGDFDEPDNPQSPSLTTRRGVALTLMHGAAEMLLPFAGFVKTLTGAQKHDQLVVEVITAGSVRRGYLKGLGEAHGCPFPAYPRHMAVEPPPVHEGRKPEYPIR
jgi:hypothetical protein